MALEIHNHPVGRLTEYRGQFSEAYGYAFELGYRMRCDVAIWQGPDCWYLAPMRDTGHGNLLSGKEQWRTAMRTTEADGTPQPSWTIFYLHGAKLTEQRVQK